MIALNTWFWLDTDWKAEEELVKSPCEKDKALRLEEVAFCRIGDKPVAGCSVKDWEVCGQSEVGERAVRCCFLCFVRQAECFRTVQNLFLIQISSLDASVPEASLPGKYICLGEQHR